MYWFLGGTERGRDRTGTVSVSAIGMFGARGGFGIGAPTLLPLSVVVGGISEKPRVIDGQVAVRNILDLTMSVDHRTVDGAPAARFMADLARMVEGGEILEEAAPSAAATR
jgi:pyruvate/2-oxoglutarate dehydrogenase complex dihydrolipoamide acyltransferase (E2) component